MAVAIIVSIIAIITCRIKHDISTKEIRRINEVSAFRKKVLYYEGIKAYMCLPTFEYMIKNYQIPVEDFAKKERMLLKLDHER